MYQTLLSLVLTSHASASCPADISNSYLIRDAYGATPKYRVSPQKGRPASPAFQARLAAMEPGDPFIFFDREHGRVVEATFDSIEGGLLMFTTTLGKQSFIVDSLIPAWSFRRLARTASSQDRLEGSAVPVRAQMSQDGTTLRDPNLGTIQHFGGVPAFHLKLLAENGVQFGPSSPPTSDGVTYKVSQVFKALGREAALVLVQYQGKQYLRAFVMSKSAGGFRLMTEMVEGAGGSSSWSKGAGEETLSAPTQLASLLAAAPRVDLPESIGRTVLEGATIITDAVWGHPRYKSEPSSIYNRMILRSALADAERTLPNSARYRRPGEPPHFFPKPEDVRFANPNHAPNWSHRVSTGQTKSPLTGKVETVETYHSRDGKLTYTVHRDDQGRVYFRSVEDSASAINEFGVRSETPALRELGMPLYEYVEQVPESYVRQPHRGRCLAWNYIREIPTVIEYYQARGLQRPEAVPLDQTGG